MTSVALRIAHLSFSSSGGAGSVASRLARIQRERGDDAFVVSATHGSLRDSPLALPRHTLAAAADEYAIKNRAFRAPISLLRDSLSTTKRATLQTADIIHLHWPHGLVNLEELAEVAGHRPVIWTLHDMAGFTGVCHYSLGCEGYTRGCTACPAVRSPFRSLVANAATEKAEVVRKFADLRVVTPSTWLAQEAQRSGVFAGKEITVIVNPLESEDIEGDDGSTDFVAAVDQSKPVFLVAAAHLEDPLKGTSDAIEAFSRAFAGGEGAALLLAGRGSSGPHTRGISHLGFLNGRQMRSALQLADYVIVASHAENQPLLIAEAQAQGVSLIGRDTTGIPEHLDIDPDGALFSSVTELEARLKTARKKSRSARNQLAARATKKFSPARAADAYARVYRGE